jgi:hypothetical protein
MDRLREIQEEARDRLEEKLSVIASGLPVAQIAEECEAAIELFQAVATSRLMLSFDTVGYQKHLAFSGYGLRYLLQRCQTEGTVDLCHLAISRTEAFFNVLAVGHTALAADIVARSPREWTPDGEYEDDYSYMAFLHHFALEPDQIDRSALEALLKRFERSLEGAPSPRLAICRAFLERNEPAFDAAFDALLMAHESWSSSNTKYRSFDPVVLMRSRLFMEGVALLLLAERLGFHTQAEYRFCPSIARRAAPDSWPFDLFLEIDRIAEEERQKRTLH